MSPTSEERIEAARQGQNPTIICKVPSGWVVICDMQYLRGYCILLADPPQPDLNTLTTAQRAQFLTDMAIVGDALLEVTGSFRINYAVLGNSDPYLHAHIVPRYMDEPEAQRKNTPWSYSPEEMNARMFDPARDQELMGKIKEAVQKRLASPAM
jgi:diadenosine tetraphosphate (Ap4A) HIT family hydrolase